MGDGKERPAGLASASKGGTTILWLKLKAGALGFGNGNGPPAAAFVCNFREGALEKLVQVCKPRLDSKLCGAAFDMLTPDPEFLRAASKGRNNHDQFSVGTFDCHPLTNETAKLDLCVVGSQIVLTKIGHRIHCSRYGEQSSEIKTMELNDSCLSSVDFVFFFCLDGCHGKP